MTAARWVAIGVLAAACERAPSRPAVAIEVRVAPRRVSIAGKDMTQPIAAAVLDQLRHRRDVMVAVPRLDVIVPMVASLPQGVGFQLSGYLDGVDPSPAAGPPVPDGFVDSDDGGGKREACLPSAASIAGSCTDATHDYCDDLDQTCHRRVPMVISRSFIAFYDERMALPNHLPAIGGLEQAMMASHPIALEITIGETGDRADPQRPPHHVGASLIGASRRAMPMGWSVPLGYVRRWNQAFAGVSARVDGYSAIDVTLRDHGDLEGFVRWAADQELVVTPGGAGIYDELPATSSSPPRT